MIKKGDLFFLVKSLSGVEKRHFRLTAAPSKGDANYLRLFDFIAAQANESDDAIRAHFRKEKFTRQLHVAKIYLSGMIMKSLRNYHAGDTSYAVLLDLLRDVEILCEKELFDACLLRLRKAEGLARQFGHHHLLLEILSWKRKIALATEGHLKPGWIATVKAEAETIAGITEINLLWQKQQELFARYSDKAFIRGLESTKPSTLRAFILLQHLKYACYYMKGDLKKAEQAVSRLFERLNRESRLLREDPGTYITSAGNKIGLLIRQQRWQETEVLLAEMRGAPARFRLEGSRKLTIRTWLRIYNLELEVYRDTRQYEKAVALIREIESYLGKREALVPADYSIMLQFQAASVFFSKGDHPAALTWTNRIMGRNYGSTRDDLQCYARLLNLVLHFELGNIIVLRYAIDNARRFFKKKKFINPVADTALRLFSRLAKVYPEDYRAVCQEAYADLCGKGAADLGSSMDYLDLKGWLGSRMHGDSPKSTARTAFTV